MGALGEAAGLLLKIGLQNNTKAGFKEVEEGAEKTAKKVKSEFEKFSDSVDGESKKIKDAAENAFKGFAQNIGLSAESTAALSTALPVVGGVIAGIAATATGAGAALFALAKNASDFGSVIKDFQDKTGLAAETITTLKYNAEQSGISLDQLGTPIAKLTKLLSDAERGSDKAQKTLAKFNITDFSDFDGALGKVLAKIHDTTDETNKSGLAMEVFGSKTGKIMRAVADNVDGDLSKAIETAKRLGITLSEEDVKAADDFGDTLHTLSVQAQSTAFHFAREFMPEITGAMGDVSKVFEVNTDTVKSWGQSVKEVLAGVIQDSKETYKWLKGLNELRATIANYLPDLHGVDIGNARFGIDNGVSSTGGRTTTVDTRSTAEAEAERQLQALSTQAGEILADRRRKAKIASEQDDIPQDLAKKTKIKKEAFELSADGKALVEAASRLGISPLDLATIISYETKGTFSTKIKGGKGGNYTGLIQFGKEEYQKYKVGKNQTFESQILNSVVPYFKDRFASVGKSTFGANILDLYKTVNGGNPNVSENASDGNGTIAQHVARMIGKNRNGALGRFFGGDEKNVHSERKEFDEVGEQLKINAELIKNNDEASNRVLDRAKQTASEQSAIDKDLLTRKVISQDEYEKRTEQADVEILNKEKILLEDRLSFAKQFGVDTIEIEQEIDSVKSQLAVKQTEAETNAYLRSKKYQEDLKALRLEAANVEIELLDVQKEGERAELERQLNKAVGSEARLNALVVLREFEIKENDRRQKQDEDAAKRERDAALEAVTDKEKEKEKVEEINRLYRDRLDIINQIHQNSQQEIYNQTQPGIDAAQRGTTGGIFGSISDIFQSAGGTDVTKGITDNAEMLKAVYGDLADTSKAAIGSMVQGLGQLAAQWLSTGKFSAKAALQMVSGVATGLAIEAGLKALMQYAEGLAMAANPFTAALAPGHFAAAAAYATAAAAAGAVGVGSGLAARAFNSASPANQTNIGKSSTSGAASGTGTPGGYYSNNANANTAQIREENRTQTIVLQVQSNDSHIVSVVNDNVENRGTLHGMIIKYVEA